MKRIPALLFFILLTISCSTKSRELSGVSQAPVETESPLHSLGLQANDVIKEINGKPITSMATGQKALAELKNQKTGVIKVLRDGKLVTINYKIK